MSTNPSRHDLFIWVESLTQTPVSTLDTLSDGVQFCQIFNHIYPSQINLAKVRQDATTYVDKEKNFHLLQNSIAHLELPFTIQIKDLAEGKQSALLELLQRLWKQYHCPSHSEQSANPPNTIPSVTEPIRDTIFTRTHQSRIKDPQNASRSKIGRPTVFLPPRLQSFKEREEKLPDKSDYFKPIRSNHPMFQNNSLISRTTTIPPQNFFGSGQVSSVLSRTSTMPQNPFGRGQTNNNIFSRPTTLPQNSIFPQPTNVFSQRRQSSNHFSQESLLLEQKSFSFQASQRSENSRQNIFSSQSARISPQITPQFGQPFKSSSQSPQPFEQAPISSQNSQQSIFGPQPMESFSKNKSFHSLSSGQMQEPPFSFQEEQGSNAEDPEQFAPEQNDSEINRQINPSNRKVFVSKKKNYPQSKSRFKKRIQAQERKFNEEQRIYGQIAPKIRPYMTRKLKSGKFENSMKNYCCQWILSSQSVNYQSYKQHCIEKKLDYLALNSFHNLIGEIKKERL